MTRQLQVSLLLPLALVSCGIAENTPSEDASDEPAPWSFFLPQDLEIPDTECINEDRRLSEEACEGEQRRVEVCQGGTWQKADSCARPDECTAGEQEPLEGYCGEHWLNTKFMECRGGLWQETCACGAADPLDFVYPYVGVIWGAEDVARLQGVSFPEILWVGHSDPDHLGHVRCAGALQLVSPEPSGLTGLFAVSGLLLDSFPYNTEGLNLRLASSIHIPNKPDPYLPGFSQVSEVRDHLWLSHTGFTDFQSFSGLKRAGTIQVDDGDKMVSFAGLSGISELKRFSFTGTESRSLISLEGLENLERVSGDLTIISTSLDAEDLKTLARLTYIGGNLSIAANPLLSACEVRQALSHVEVVGKVSLVNNRHGCDCPEEFCE